MESRVKIRDAKVAAALGTLGVEIEIKKTTVTRIGADRVLFLLGLRSVDGRTRPRHLMGRFEKGELERVEPAHEFLTCLRAMQNREMILDFLKQGIPIELRPVPGTEIWQYVKGGTGLPGVHGQAAIVETTDLKVVAALGLVGIPLLSVDGVPGSYRFRLRLMGPPRAGGVPPADGHLLRMQWLERRDEMDPLCAFGQGMWGLYNRERLVSMANAQQGSILLEKPRSKKAVVLSPHAGPRAWDEAKEHFD